MTGQPTDHLAELNTTVEPKELGDLLLRAGITLLASGASCSRIRITMTRLAFGYDYAPHITIGPKSVSLTLNDKDGITLFNGSRSTPSQNVNFKMISGISRLSWRAIREKSKPRELQNELDKLFAAKHYSRLVILSSVSLAGAAFCYTFGGNALEMLIAFGATFCGLLVKQELWKRSFNPYMCTYVAALVASLFTGAFHEAGLTVTLEHAFSTCVLFLIPGVPLINSFTDLIDGNILNGIVRGVNALIYALAIAFGLLTTIIIYNF